MPSDLGNRDLPDLVLELNEETDVAIHTFFINTTEVAQPVAGRLPPPARENPLITKAAGDMEQIAEDSGGSFRLIE